MSEAVEVALQELAHHAASRRWIADTIEAIIARLSAEDEPELVERLGRLINDLLLVE